MHLRTTTWKGHQSGSPNRLPLTPSLYSPFGTENSPQSGKDHVRRSLGNRSPETPTVRWHNGEAWSKDMEPVKAFHSPEREERQAGHSSQSARRVSFSTSKIVAHQQANASLFSAMGLLKQGSTRFDGGHFAPSGATYVDHRLETPENRIKRPPLGGQERKASQITIASETFWNDDVPVSTQHHPCPPFPSLPPPHSARNISFCFLLCLSSDPCA